MSQESAELLEKALALSVEERAEAAHGLLENLDDAQGDARSVEAAWGEEIARRAAELDFGEVKPVSLDEFRRKMLSAAE